MLEGENLKIMKKIATHGLHDKVRNSTIILVICLVTGLLFFLSALGTGLVKTLEHAYSQQEAASSLLGEEGDIMGMKDKYQERLPYLGGMLLVFIIGLFVLASLLQSAVHTDIRLYGSMKTLGASRRQIGYCVWCQLLLYAIAGILIGLIAGWLCCYILFPVVLPYADTTPVILPTAGDFGMTLLLSFLIIILSAIMPIWTAVHVSPTELVKMENSYGSSMKGGRYPGLPFLFQLGLANLLCERKRVIRGSVILIIGLVMLSSVTVILNSFDIDKYKQLHAISDFTLLDQSISDVQGIYDPESRTITHDLVQEVEALDGLKSMGILSSQNVPVSLNDFAYERIIAYYEGNEEEILHYMSYDQDWTLGYEKMKESHSLTAVLYGVDGQVLDCLAEYDRLLSGVVDQKKFLSGKYVIAQGIADAKSSGGSQPTYQAGDIIILGHESFEVMAIVDIPYVITEGGAGAEAAFNIGFFVSGDKFRQMYPDCSIRKLFFNAYEDGIREAAQLIERYRTQVPYVSEETIIEKYEKETMLFSVIQITFCMTILCIGVFHMLYCSISSVKVRKKEFAEMAAIGMTKRQLKLLLVLENLDFVVITLIISYFLSFVVISTGIKFYLETQWTATYQFTIAPLLLFTPVLIILAVIMPLLSIRNGKASVLYLLDCHKR